MSIHRNLQCLNILSKLESSSSAEFHHRLYYQMAGIILHEILVGEKKVKAKVLRS